MQDRAFRMAICLKAGEFEYQDPVSESDVVNVNFILHDGTVQKVRGKVGDNVMYLAHRYFLDAVKYGMIR